MILYMYNLSLIQAATQNRWPAKHSVSNDRCIRTCIIRFAFLLLIKTHRYWNWLVLIFKKFENFTRLIKLSQSSISNYNNVIHLLMAVWVFAFHSSLVIICDPWIVVFHRPLASVAPWITALYYITKMLENVSSYVNRQNAK